MYTAMNFTGSRKYSIPMTRAFELVRKGMDVEALQVIKDAGIPEAEKELKLIINFVRRIKNSK